MGNPSTIAKYLSRYAEPQHKHRLDFPSKYQHVAVIPCYAESYSTLEANIQQSAFEDSLLILVVNQPTSRVYNTHPDNQSLVDELYQHYSVCSTSGQLTLLSNTVGLDILLVDSYSEGYTLAPKQGVGLARKIGNDIALALIQAGHIKQPWLFNTDADAQVPANYFQCINNSNRHTACFIYPYVHRKVDNPQLNKAMLSYQQYLDHYVEGLLFAGSPYAWHSLGSILCINAEHYAMVRGFPKRSAGEDFHILNKLTKTGSINQLQHPVIDITTRLSNRVPFGTGPALDEIMNGNNKQRFHQQCFKALKQWLDSWQSLWNKACQKKFNCLTDIGIDKQYIDILNTLGIDQLIQHSLKQSSDFDGFCKQMHIGFDALKTLQFIRAIDEHKQAIT